MRSRLKWDLMVKKDTVDTDCNLVVLQRLAVTLAMMRSVLFGIGAGRMKAM